MRRGFKSLTAIITVSTVAACAPAPKVVPVPPPPPVIIVPPPPPVMPLPPGGAATSMRIPTIGIDGVRTTPNRGLSREQSIWHFRSAINVAALNCQGPVWGQIATEYNKFIITHKIRLSQASKAVDKEYIARYTGQNGLRVRDTQMTDLYNYFSLPPVKAEYCDTALRKVVDVNLIPSAALPEYAFGALGDIDGIYIRFFDAYVQYERDLADWNMKYAPPPIMYAPLQPQPPITTPPITTPPITTPPITTPPIAEPTPTVLPTAVIQPPVTNIANVG